MPTMGEEISWEVVFYETARGDRPAEAWMELMRDVRTALVNHSLPIAVVKELLADSNDVP